MTSKANSIVTKTAIAEAKSPHVVASDTSPDAVAAKTDRAAANSHRKLFWRIAFVFFLVAIALGVLLPGYQLFQASMVLSFMVALVGVNVLTGYNGQISLGHGAFFALGAYATAMLIEKAGVPYWLSVPGAGVIALGVGYVFGRPALKLEGLYLALATLALAIATPPLLKYKGLEKWTGGVAGLGFEKPHVPAGLPLTDDQWIYSFCVAATMVMLWIARNVIDSGTGRALRAIRDHSAASETMGIDNRHYKCMAFGLSAAFAAVGGGMSAVAVQYVSPDSFPLFLSITLLVGIVVGGLGTLWGALFGAVFVMFVPQLANVLSKSAPWAAYGVVVIAFVFVLPGGVMEMLVRVRRNWTNKLH
jgi:branched-chain amino acid transport system permease protein